MGANSTSWPLNVVCFFLAQHRACLLPNQIGEFYIPDATQVCGRMSGWAVYSSSMYLTNSDGDTQFLAVTVYGI